MTHRKLNRGRSTSIFIAAAAFAAVLEWQPGAAMAQAAPIPDGRYHCKAGSSFTMLTLGDIEISGTDYTFTTPTGEQTSGSYAVTPSGYQWQGDLGALTNDQIVESGPDLQPGYFYFKYKARPTSLPTTLSCGRV